MNNNSIYHNLKAKKVRKIAVIGRYPPVQCGIASFTYDLVNAIRLRKNTKYEIKMFTFQNNEKSDFSTHELQVLKDHYSSYLYLSRYLNDNDFDIVYIQHEFGIYGGLNGSFILLLMRKINAPIVVTLHTVLRILIFCS